MNAMDENSLPGLDTIVRHSHASLVELATGVTNERLRSMAHSIGSLTRLRGDDIPELTWRLYLPDTRESILGANR